MYFTSNTQTLYPATGEYNLCLILSELATIVANEGGTIKPRTLGTIVNRTLYEIANDYRRDAENFRAHAEKEPDAVLAAKLERAAANATAKAEAVEAIPNEPRTIKATTYLEFTLNGYIYTVRTPENPYFIEEYTYSKSKIDDAGKYPRYTYSNKLDIDAFMWDCFFRARTTENGKAATDEDRREAANIIFNQIIAGPESKIARDGRRTRVPNRYNNGYHYETIYRPIEYAKVDF